MTRNFITGLWTYSTSPYSKFMSLSLIRRRSNDIIYVGKIEMKVMYRVEKQEFEYEHKYWLTG